MIYEPQNFRNVPRNEWIMMLGGGSHRANAKVRRDLETIPHYEDTFGYSFLTSRVGKFDSKKRIFHVHPDFVQECRALKMTVMKLGKK